VPRIPGLRFDKVVTRVTDRLRAALGDVIPARTAVLITITAPIRLPGKTAGAIEEKVHRVLASKGSRNVKTTVHGNGIRIRVVKSPPGRGPNVRVFVHNPDVDPVRVLNDA
jgi:hypothetical protein